MILATILEMDDPSRVFASISIYMVTVITGLFVHGKNRISQNLFSIKKKIKIIIYFHSGFIFLPLVYWLITRKNVLVYTKNVLEALLIALATASR